MRRFSRGAGSEYTAIEHHRQGKCFSVHWPLLCRTTTVNDRSPVMLTSISATPSTRHSHPRIPCVFHTPARVRPGVWHTCPGKGFLLINRREYFQCRSITPVLWSRQGTSPHPEPPSAELPDRSHDRRAERGYDSRHPSPSARASDAHHPV